MRCRSRTCGTRHIRRSACWICGNVGLNRKEVAIDSVATGFNAGVGQLPHPSDVSLHPGLGRLLSLWTCLICLLCLSLLGLLVLNLTLVLLLNL